jgi:ABC-type proline/glycine betaine transport system permease subunit
MNLSRISPQSRFAIAIGASIGIGQALFRGFTENFGPVTGLILGTVAAASVALGIYWLLEWSAKRQSERVES